MTAFDEIIGNITNPDEAIAAFDAITSKKLSNSEKGMDELVSYSWMPGQPCDPRGLAMQLLIVLEKHPDRQDLTRQILLEHLNDYAYRYVRVLVDEPVMETEKKRWTVLIEYRADNGYIKIGAV
jgi:hypothetical protein